MLLTYSVFPVDIPIAKVEMRSFYKELEINSQIIQLSSAKRDIMSRMKGKITHYYINVGERVKKGQKIARIESLKIMEDSSTLASLHQQLKPLEANYQTTKKLYDIGIASKQELNEQSIEPNIIRAKIRAIQSNLALIGVKDKGANSYTLYAESSGLVTKIIEPLYAVVESAHSLVEIINKQSIFVKSFLPVRYASQISINQKGSISYQGEETTIKVDRILPNLDEKTQQIVVLSTIEKPVQNLFVNTFVTTKFALGADKKHLCVHKSALSFYNNRWVVFVPKEEHHDEHDEHEKEELHDEHKGHDDHDNHDEHEEEIPYEIKVVKIIKQNKNYTAIEGLHEGDEYVSDKSYHVKSLLLKSSMGGHGH